MMKKRFLCCLCLAIFTAVSLFGFTACSNGSSYDDSALVDRIEALEEQITSLENDNTANKTDIQTLKTKVEALEAANENFQQQLAALDTSSDTFADDLAELTSNYNTLAASVQNATHIERVIIKEEDIGTDKMIKYCSLSSSNSEGELIIGCGIEFSAKLFHYQLLTCEVSVTYNEQTSNISIYLSRADHNSDRTYLNGGTATGIPMTGNTGVTTSLIEIVLYRFD